MNPLKVGVIGWGRISDMVFKSLSRFSMVEVVACVSLDPEESRAGADPLESRDARMWSPQIPRRHRWLQLPLLAAGVEAVRSIEAAVKSRDNRGGWVAL